MSDFLLLESVAKRFGEATVLEEISLSVAEGETLALLGPSGSGKTTLLRLVAGFELPDRGRIEVDGRDITRLPPARRRFGMVFQHYALFPHLSVGENVAFGLEPLRLARADRETRVGQVLELVDLAGFETRRVHEISGGQQQRVALARALAPRPQVLLLDEPLSNLDPALRERTRGHLRRTLDRVGITALWVTHEQEEAFDVGERVAVLHRGRLEQVGPPERLYLEPASPFVARFVGRASTVPGTLVAAGRVRPAAAGEDGPEWTGIAVADLAAGEEVDLIFRPEALELKAPGTAGALPAEVVARRYAGAQTFFTVRLGCGAELEVIAAAGAAREGDRAAVAPRPGAAAPRIFRRERGGRG